MSLAPLRDIAVAVDLVGDVLAQAAWHRGGLVVLVL
jgi:hypothetical protein